LSTGLDPANFLLSCRQIHAEAAPFLYGENRYRVVCTQALVRALTFKPPSCFIDFSPSIYHPFINEVHIELSAGRSTLSAQGADMEFWRALSDATRLFPNIVPNVKRIVLHFEFLRSDQLLWTWPDRLAFNPSQQHACNSLVARYEKYMASRFPLYLKDCPEVELKVSCAMSTKQYGPPCGGCDLCWPGKILEWRSLEEAFNILKHRTLISIRPRPVEGRLKRMHAKPANDSISKSRNETNTSPSKHPDPETLANLGREDAIQLLHARMRSSWSSLESLPAVSWQNIIKEIYWELDDLRRKNEAVDRSIGPLCPEREWQNPVSSSLLYRGNGGFSARDVHMLETLNWLVGLSQQELVSVLSNSGKEPGASNVQGDFKKMKYQDMVDYLVWLETPR
jgi:hypothetical protein